MIVIDSFELFLRDTYFRIRPSVTEEWREIGRFYHDGLSNVKFDRHPGPQFSHFAVCRLTPSHNARRLEHGYYLISLVQRDNEEVRELIFADRCLCQFFWEGGLKARVHFEQYPLPQLLKPLSAEMSPIG